MDGRLFLLDKATPPPAAFAFDLQRFDDPPANEPAQANNALSDTQVTEEGDNKSVFSCVIGGATKYGTANDFTSENLKNATEIKLLGNFTMSGTVNISSNKVTLDLNGQILTKTSKGSAFVIENGPHTFEITDSGTGGTILHTYDIVGDDKTDEQIKDAQKHTRYNYNNDAAFSSVISVGDKNSGDTGKSSNGATFNMTGGTIESNTSCISAGNNSKVTINGNSKLQSFMSSVVYLGNRDAGGHVLDISGNAHLISGETFSDTETTKETSCGTLTTKKNSNLPAIQVSGNYTQTEGTSQLTVNISGNSVVEFRNDEKHLLKSGNDYLGSPSAVYIGGYTKLTIEDNAKITSAGTGVEMRSGNLEVTGGTITSTAESYTAHPANSGTASFGAAIAIAQHEENSGKRPIGVSISGDNTNIAGPNALAVSNPQENNSNTSASITATIDGGNLKSTKGAVTGNTSQSGNAVLADNCNVFITVNNGNLNGNVSVSKVVNADENTNKATVVVAGGTTTGTVKVVEVGNEGESTPPDATTNLKVMGGKITDKSSAETYKAAGVEVSSDGTVTESTKNGWSLTSDANGKYIHGYMLDGATNPLLSVSLGSAAGDSVYLKYDSTNKLFGIPYSDSATPNYAWDGGEDGDAKKGRYLAQQTVVGSAASIRPMTTGVKISGTGFISSDIVSLTTASGTGTLESLGVVVDATDNRLAYIIGGKGKDSIKAGDRRTTLDGGANDDTLDGGDGIDTFYYSAGNDEIRNYTHGTDAVSITGDFTPPIDFTKATFGGSNFIFTFGNDDKNKLTFRNTSKVSLVKDNKVYTYEGNTGGNLNYMAIEGEGISLGTGYSGRFNGAATANADYKTINGARVNSAIRITGNDNPNFIVASSVGGGTLEGGEGNDTLYSTGGASTASLRFEGGAGSDSLVGGNGYNLFVYTEGDDKIKGYHGKDLVTVRGNAANLETADFAFTENDIKLGFGSGDSLTFEGGATVENGVSVQSGKNLYVYKKDRIARNDEVITLTSGFADSIFSAGTYNTINAAAVSLETGAISISGNDNNNVIFGSKQGGTLFGGAGNDKLDVLTNERADEAQYVFKYTEGKDTVSGFVAGNDKLDITAKRLGEISKAKSSKGDTRLAFTFNTSKSDVLTFNSDGDEIGRVSLSGNNGFLTKDGVVSLGSGGNRLDLFSSARGKIDLTEAPYVGTEIKEVNAENVKKQSVTLIGGTQGGQFTFAENNKKKDQFEYNGGSVTISGYEAGKDRLDLNTAALTGFTVGTGADKNVSLRGAGDDDVVVLKGMKEQEVLLHHAESRRNSFTKMVFKDTGVILNKEKRPTMATVSASYDASGDNTVKKIFVADGADNISITAGDRNKTTLDASAASGASLVSGAKNDKLIGSTSASDTFVYTEGKDIIQNYSSNDHISLGGSLANSLTSAKISTGSRSIKFKFSNKNALTIKPAKGSTLGSALDISGIPNYTYSKNAIISGSNATLTSEFSGSYRLKNSGVNNVNGSLVKKNLTFRGTSSDETLAGGTKKTTFKGGGGNDAFTGGSGNDIFFYAKGDTGNTTIADFDFNKDKLKIASGTITNISTVSGGIKFDMNNGRKNSANIGSFQINSSATYGTTTTKGTAINPNSTLIKANNTYLWFATEAGKDVSGNSYSIGDLITANTKVSKSDATATGYAIIDLGYSSNLVNAGVATKASETFTFGGSDTNKIKKST